MNTQTGKIRKAVYAASLDPITNGHINVIERMAPRYDELIVMVAVAFNKNYTFTPEERVSMTSQAVDHIPNVTVELCLQRYVVKKAEELGAQVVIRGIRNFKDLEDEETLAEENRNICPGIETIWIPCWPNLKNVSSSMVKGHIGADPGWEEQVARSVPKAVAAKLKEKFILKKARAHWDSLMKSIGNPDWSEKTFADFVTRYGEAHRQYHTLEHIVWMLDEFELVSELAEDKVSIKKAIWAHDTVYDTRVRNSEKQSAIVARSFGQHVTNLIIATEHKSTPVTTDSKILVDLDLAILGRPEKEFDRYEEGIRHEYGWVPDSDFCAGRIKVLQYFLERPSIYSMEFFRNKYESTARRNIARSIEKLKG